MPKKMPIIWNNIKYPSMATAARIVGISRQAMEQRIKKGYTSDNDIKRVVVWNGIEYPSMAMAARIVGISRQTMEYRIKKGYTSDNDMNP